MVVGLVLVILGAVLLYVPLVPSSETFQATDGFSCAESGASTCVNYSLFDASPALLGGTMAKLTFSSSGPVFFTAITCSKTVTTSQLQSATSNAQAQAVCGTEDVVYNGTQEGAQTSGSASFSIPSSGTLIFVAISDGPGPSVSTSLTYSEPLAGFILLIVGILLLLVGLVAKGKKAKAAAAAAGPQPWNPNQPTPPGAVGPGAPAGWQPGPGGAPPGQYPPGAYPPGPYPPQ